jgi:glycogen operon protein
MLDFTKKILNIRKEHPALHRTKFFQGRQIRGSSIRDIIWYRPDGGEMDDDDWQNPNTKGLTMFLGGSGIDDVDEEGVPLHDDNLLLLFNASMKDVEFYTPRFDAEWELLVDTNLPGSEEQLGAEAQTTINGRSLKLFICRSEVHPAAAPFS